ncbi:hypothetical protein ACIBG0_08045 [Nocardia sp. NPDC050630]|uniref:hypothetical protein n=1 Tax=Nocardia sp. NPDC050630 TaxID=3364321 RepID=UPI003789B3AE
MNPYTIFGDIVAGRAEASRVYEDDDVRNVSGTLGDMIGRSSCAVLQHLERARKEGMLTSVPGRAGGRVTEKAAQILQRTVPNTPGQ